MNLAIMATFCLKSHDWFQERKKIQEIDLEFQKLGFLEYVKRLKISCNSGLHEDDQKNVGSCRRLGSVAGLSKFELKFAQI